MTFAIEYKNEVDLPTEIRNLCDCCGAWYLEVAISKVEYSIKMHIFFTEIWIHTTLRGEWNNFNFFDRKSNFIGWHSSMASMACTPIHSTRSRCVRWSRNSDEQRTCVQNSSSIISSSFFFFSILVHDCHCHYCWQISSFIAFTRCRHLCPPPLPRNVCNIYIALLNLGKSTIYEHGCFIFWLLWYVTHKISTVLILWAVTIFFLLLCTYPLSTFLFSCSRANDVYVHFKKCQLCCYERKVINIININKTN